MPQDQKPKARTPLVRLVAGTRVVVRLKNEQIEGTVLPDTEIVQLDRRAKDDSVHMYDAEDGYGRATRVRVVPSQCVAADLLGIDCPRCAFHF